jgi:hypothetical protein
MTTDKDNDMHRQLITLTHGDTMISSPDVNLVRQVFMGLVDKLPANSATSDFTPALGEYWPGQGGINGGPGPARGDVPAHYLIFAAKDVGDHEYGGRGDESGATSKWDGLANTKELLIEGDHPAAEACAVYTADGHSDFYLGAAAEMYQAWVNAPESFSKDVWYQTSTQRSANNAFLMVFDVGYQNTNAKNSELRVRPVRRLFI